MSTNKAIRQPIQKRSIAKKKKIIKAGFHLFSERGFYSTNTTEIAKEAGVSVGVVYNYFEDKKAIFLDVILLYMNLLTEPMYQLLSNLDQKITTVEFVELLLDAFIKGHNMTKNAHEEMLYMAHSDPDVAKLFHEFEVNVSTKLAEILVNFGLEPTNIKERIIVAKGLMENYCHAVVYDENKGINYLEMKQIVIKQVLLLFDSELS